MTHPSLLRRLVIWQIGAMVSAWLGLSVWIMVTMLALGNGDLDRRMGYLAQTLAESASAGQGDPAELQRRLRNAERIFVDGVIADLNPTSDYMPRYRVSSAEGRLLFATDGMDAIPASAAPGEVTESTLQDHVYRIVGAVSSDGAVRVDVAERVAERWLWSLPMLRTILTGQLLILGWCLAGMVATARRGLRPLRMLADALANRTPGDLTPVAVERVYSETAPIVQEMNGLLSREARRLEAERGFLADAAHELRTPLAALGAQTHLLVNASDAPTRALIAGELGEGMQRISHLLSQLLSLARLDTAPAGKSEKVDIAELCRERLAVLTALARRRGISLGFTSPPSLHGRVRPEDFASIVDNLVDNAIRYTPVGGQVEVALERTDSVTRFTVRDNGPGISDDERPRVVERFYRIAGTEAEGSGLGLAIVTRITQAHSGTLRFVEGLAGRGVGVEVSLPALTQDAASA